jgi:adenine-specific DNA-methyltransferase
MNIRKAEIEKFLTIDLPQKVTATLTSFAGNKETLVARKKELEQQAEAFKANVEKNDEYIEIKEKLAQGADLSALETDVYSHLYNFFNRYYDEGDFISKRRYKEGVYAIPYEGEEVKLYWANQDQYYIKTSENFKDYRFTANGKAVHFILVDATQEQNNNKERDDKKRAFMLYAENKGRPGIKTFEVNENEFIIRFIYDVSAENQKFWNEKNYEAISAYIATRQQSWLLIITPPERTKTNPAPKSLLQRHLESYVAKNTFDYFIHKDLGGFLRRELDFYIKNEIIHLDDIDTANAKRVETYLAAVKAVKQVGKIIIDFLAQIENFQKKLWLKKKFIVRTDWCITLDRIDEGFYEEIRNNKAQVREWIELYGIDTDELAISEKWTNPPSAQFLKRNKNLLIDTKHFSQEFKEKLIVGIDNLDEVTDGVLIHGENFHAVNLIRNKYKSSIDCVYIDPPYNSGDNDIPYKNGYKDSSWLSLLENTIYYALELIANEVVFFIAIDDYEVIEMCNMLRNLLPDYSLDISIIEHHPQGGKATVLSTTHDYMVILMKNQRPLIGRYFSDEVITERRPFKRSGTAASNFRYARQNSFYAILVDSKNNVVGLEPPSIGNYTTENTKEGYRRIYPIGRNNTERVWRKSYKSCIELVENKKLICSGNDTIYQLLESHEKRTAFFSVLKDKRYNASTYGANLLKGIMGEIRFSYPKSLYTVEDALFSIENDAALVIDYFAGSATTGHAVLELNRLDDGSRKYILVEMGEYFNTVTKPRMQKVIYAREWKDGKPTARDTGVSHIMKYFRLESYEDTLTNIALSDETHQRNVLFGDDYLIHYMLDTESKGSLINIDKFKMPFDYTLKITEHNEIKETPIDLPETFNYLLGLNVIRQGAVQYFKSRPAAKPEYENAVDLKPDSKSGEYGFKQIEGRLSDDRRVLIIWRNITEDINASNAALDAYFLKSRINPQDREFDLIYVNGSNNLENLRLETEQWEINIIEKEFFDRMFEEG